MVNSVRCVAPNGLGPKASQVKDETDQNMVPMFNTREVSAALWANHGR
jgi:hypothetical protein